MRLREGGRFGVNGKKGFFVVKDWGFFVVKDWRGESGVRARERGIESAKHEGIRGFLRGEGDGEGVAWIWNLNRYSQFGAFNVWIAFCCVTMGCGWSLERG
jgi:hypothetical protein